MAIDGAGMGKSVARAFPLADEYRLLDDKRIDIDRRMTNLAPGDPARETLWLEMEPVLAKLREVVSKLAQSPAPHLAAVQAKAEILATLLRPEEDGGGPAISEAEKSALALSLTDDIARLPIG